MIVEDEFVVAADIKVRLEAMDYLISARVTTGQEAINRAEMERPDLVLMDILLRGEIDGIQAAQEIHSRLGIPVIFLTGLADRERIERAKATEPFGYLTKPLNDVELKACVEIALYKAKMERQLVDSERRFRGFFESAGVGMVVLDPDNRFVRANSFLCDMLGYSEEELTGRRAEEMIPPEDVHIVQAALKRIWESGTDHESYEKRFIHRDGHLIWARISLALIRDGNGVPLYFTTQIQDITESRRTMEALRKSELWMRSIFNSQDDAVLAVSRDGHLIKINIAAERMFGYSNDEVAGQSTEIFHVDRHHYLEFNKNINMAFKNDQTARFEFKAKRKNGEIFPTEHTVSSLKNDAGETIGIVSVVSDITQRVRAEETLRVQRMQLRSLAVELTLTEERQRRALAADLHDRVGQSLAMARIKLEQEYQAGASSRKEPLKKVLKLLEGAIRDIRMLIFEISPQTLYELGLPTALIELTEQFQKEFGLRIQMTDDGASKSLAGPAQIILYRATRELLSNTVKHARAEHVRIVSKRVGDKIRIEVHDDGVGFNPNEYEKGSTGIKSYGLFSLRERIAYLNGTCEIDSRPGKGTSVTLSLPLA